MVFLYMKKSRNNLDTVLKLDSAIRIILKLNNVRKSKKISCKNHFKELGVLTVYGLYMFETIHISKQRVSYTVIENRITQEEHIYA